IAKRGADVLPELLEMVLQYDPDKDIDVQGDNWGLSRLGLAFIGNHWQLNEAQAQKIFDRFIKGRSYDEADKNYWEQIWKASRHILMNQGFKFEE
ncbi:MAG: hypothetical protein KKD07_04250, partial [Candidatus Omnitrophica bacterium]|nr:hypothetical protein [Candidatus Omnitrophota bacterium]